MRGRYGSSIGAFCLLVSVSAAAEAKTQCETYLEMTNQQKVMFVSGVVQGVRWTAFDLYQLKRQSDRFELESKDFFDVVGQRYSKTAERLGGQVGEMVSGLQEFCKKGEAKGSLVVALARIISYLAGRP